MQTALIIMMMAGGATPTALMEPAVPMELEICRLQDTPIEQARCLISMRESTDRAVVQAANNEIIELRQEYGLRPFVEAIKINSN